MNHEVHEVHEARTIQASGSASTSRAVSRALAGHFLTAPPTDPIGGVGRAQTGTSRIGAAHFNKNFVTFVIFVVKKV